MQIKKQNAPFLIESNEFWLSLMVERKSVHVIS